MNVMTVDGYSAKIEYTLRFSSGARFSVLMAEPTSTARPRRNSEQSSGSPWRFSSRSAKKRSSSHAGTTLVGSNFEYIQNFTRGSL